jgi:hypothetical protein
VVLIYLITAIVAGPIAFSGAKLWQWRRPLLAAAGLVVLLWCAETVLFVWAQKSDIPDTPPLSNEDLRKHE